jgi:antidote-toxin recognition MazE-like antitoxin
MAIAFGLKPERLTGSTAHATWSTDAPAPCDSLSEWLHVTFEGAPMVQQRRPKSSRQKVAAHRQRLRKQGLRPIQIWVPDVRAPGFAEEAHRQSLAVARSRHAKADQDFIDAISDLGSDLSDS